MKRINFTKLRTTGGGEGPRERGLAIGGGETCRGGKERGDEARLTAKTFGGIFTGDVVPVRDIGDDGEPPDSCDGD